MSGRCKSCDTILDEQEMVQKWPNTETYCELCNHCLSLSDDIDLDEDWDSCYTNDTDGVSNDELLV